MAEPIDAAADPVRRRLIRSVFHYASLEEVAAAVAVAAAEGESWIYVERAGQLYRWSLGHPGGAYPLLRTFARFLKVDYRLVFIGFTTVPGGLAVAVPDPKRPIAPDAWAVLSRAELDAPEGIGQVISRALECATNVEGGPHE